MTDTGPAWAAAVRPGDTLIVALEGPRSREQVERTAKLLADEFEPIGVRVCVIDGVRQMTVVRTGDVTQRDHS
ncbi:hypothetical protein [Krasilnikovia sp. MM14-A1259]|uniref:hypothetical protein n=1 Tax=Krasilnikovia sp. MM14-A1259 TaxID=3373539 RepID=UPI00382449FF